MRKGLKQMFEAKTTPQATASAADVITPASPSHSVITFPNKPVGKATTGTIHDIIQQNLFPVIAWKLMKDGSLKPLSIVPLDDPASTAYLAMPNAKVFKVSDPSVRWNTFDQFVAHLVQQMLRTAQSKSPAVAVSLSPPPPPPADPVVDAAMPRGGFY
jgi:hypothetical protein